MALNGDFFHGENGKTLGNSPFYAMKFGHRITYGHANMFVYSYQATQSTYHATRGSY